MFRSWVGRVGVYRSVAGGLAGAGARDGVRECGGRARVGWTWSVRVQVTSHWGLLVRSCAAGAGERDLNLVMWRWGDDRPTRVGLVDEEDCLARP